MNLRTRLAVFIAATVGGAVAMVAFVAYGFISNEARAEDDDFLKSRGPVVGIVGALEIGDFLPLGSSRGPGRGPNEFAAFEEVIREDAVAQFVKGDGLVVSLGYDPVVLPVDEQDLEIARLGGPDYFRDATIDGVHYRMLTRSLFEGLAIQVGRDVTATDEILGTLQFRLTLLGLAGVGLAAIVAWLVARRSLRPVALLTEAAEHISETKNLEARIDVGRGDELGRLAAAFNGMLAALEEARSSQQRLVTDASHELRTPLTSLRTNIELLARDAVAAEGRDELLEDLTAEVTELSHLVAEVVDLATIGREEEPEQWLDLDELVARAVDRARRRFSLPISADLEETSVSGRPNSLQRAVSNLLDNAAKWGAEGSSIEVILRGGELAVRDHGPGLAEEDIPRVFERFYRAADSRSLPGSGLGLAIVAAIVEEHGGTVFARNHPEGGAEVGFRIPSDQ